MAAYTYEHLKGIDDLVAFSEAVKSWLREKRERDSYKLQGEARADSALPVFRLRSVHPVFRPRSPVFGRPWATRLPP